MPPPTSSIPVRVNPPPDSSSDYISRATLGALLTKGAASVVVGVMARGMAADAMPQHVLTAAGAASPLVSPAVATLDRIVDSVMNGTDLSPAFPDIARLTHAQDQRAEVVSQIVLTHDYARLARVLKARDVLEDALCAKAMNGDLLPSEAVLVLDRLDAIATATRKAVAAESTSIHDIQALLQKIDYVAETAGAVGLSRKFDKTSPQGREVVRKLLLGVSKKIGSASRPADA